MDKYLSTEGIITHTTQLLNQDLEYAISWLHTEHKLNPKWHLTLSMDIQERGRIL
ncbi:MAG: hypothetical protein AB8U16_02050 [Rickettsiales endosymbiont of Dermacentor nuttalli]